MGCLAFRLPLWAAIWVTSYSLSSVLSSSFGLWPLGIVSVFCHHNNRNIQIVNKLLITQIYNRIWNINGFHLKIVSC